MGTDGAPARFRLRFHFHRSFRLQMLLSILGVFLILVISTAYILTSARRLQKISESAFEKERFINALQEDLLAYQSPLMEYLSTRSSNALAQILIDTQMLRQKLPVYSSVTADKVELREKELYSLIFSYLNLAEQAMEEKRGRNISAYTKIYEEMAALMEYINREIDTLSTERFRGQLDSYEQLLSVSGTIQLWNFLFLISVLLFAIQLLFMSVNRFTGPLLRLSAMAQELSAGNFAIPDMETGVNEEMDRMIGAFNNMKNEIRKYIEEIRLQDSIKQEYMQEKMRNMKMEGLVRHMEIYALQAQMNPHFLFNTINTGMQLAIVEGADRTGEYMECMARLFRHIIRNKEIIVPLRHEIEGLEYYFYILRVRFPRDLELGMDCGASLLDACRVPVSILQPLVENSVIHAFREQEDGRTRRIEVRAVLEETPGGKRLVLSVGDNGCGMEGELVEKLLHPQSIDESSVSRVMGLENVIQRLYFFYPEDPGVVRIETNRNKAAGMTGTKIVIAIDTEREPCLAL